MNTATVQTNIETEDFELIQEFKNGKEEAFNRLVLKHKNRIFNLCFSFLGIYEDANDCAQETFIKMYNALDKFRMDARFSTWLYRIAVNTCKNRLSSAHFRRKKNSVSLESIPDLIPDQKSGDPEIDNERKNQRIKIQQCIDALPADQKSIVLLRDMDGLAYEEITSIIKQTLGTVKSRLARARQKLRQCLKGKI